LCCPQINHYTFVFRTVLNNICATWRLSVEQILNVASGLADI